MKKLSIFREDEELPCPFGLRIGHACHTAGNTVDLMTTLNNENNKEILSKNLEILNEGDGSQKCKYANHLFKNNSRIVDCDYGTPVAGISQDVVFNGSPYYSQIDKGLGIGGYLNYPVTNQTDGIDYRELYYGISTWASKQEVNQILRETLEEILKDKL